MGWSTPSPALWLITSALRREPAPWTTDRTAEVWELAGVHGVRSLLYHQLKTTSSWGTWPRALRDRLATAARQQTAAEMMHQRELMRVLEALAYAGVRPLIIKGSALAYTVYEEPSTRTRGDSDLFIHELDRPAMARALTSLDYEPVASAGGETLSYQQLYDRGAFAIDVHWRVSNVQLFAAALTFAEADAAATAVAALGSIARTLCTVHALFLALMHRAAHVNAPYFVAGSMYYEPNRLIWLYDILLLVAEMRDADWRLLVDLAEKRRVRAVCIDGLLATRDALGTHLPDWVLQRLRSENGAELSDAYLHRGRVRHLLAELRALPTWSTRKQLIIDLAMPPADYMLGKYKTDRRALLPWLYVRRGVEGLVKLFKG